MVSLRYPLHPHSPSARLHAKQSLSQPRGLRINTKPLVFIPASRAISAIRLLQLTEWAVSAPRSTQSPPNHHPFTTHLPPIYTPFIPNSHPFSPAEPSRPTSHPSKPHVNTNRPPSAASQGASSCDHAPPDKPMTSLRLPHTTQQKARPAPSVHAGPSLSPGGVLLSQGLPPRVSSALEGLTVVFGMGTRVSPPL